MKQKSIKVNFFMNILLTISNLIFPLITFPYVARVLKPEGTGKVSLAVSVVSYFAMFAQLGIPTYGIRACAKVRDDQEELSKTVHELCFINLCMTAIVYVVFLFVIRYVPKFENERQLLLIVSTSIFFNMLGMEWLYKAMEEYSYITIRSMIFKLISLGLMFALVRSKNDYTMYGAITIFAASASNVFNFLNIHKFISMNIFHKYELKKHMKPIMILFAMSCATTVYTNLDTVMIGLMKSDVEVGYYNAAVKIKNILLGVVTSLGTVLLPRASYYVEHNMKDRLIKQFKKSVAFVCILSSAFMVYFIIFAKEGIFFLSGELYRGSIIPMMVIMPTLLFIGLTNGMGMQVLVPVGRETDVLKSVIVGASIDFLINVLLIAKIGCIGAAIGTLVAELCVYIYQRKVVLKFIQDMYSEIDIKNVIVAIFIASLMSVGIKFCEYTSFIKLVLSAIVFFVTYVLVLGVVVKEPLMVELYQKTLDMVKKRLRI